jgi:aminopeptidase N
MDRHIIGTSFDLNKYLHTDIVNILNYLASIVNKTGVKICFISTAQKDSILQKLIFRIYVKLYYPQWEVWCPDTSEVVTNVEKLLSSDIIFVGGGNTIYMLKSWKECGLDILLYNAYQKGIIISGISAGLIFPFNSGVTDSNGPLEIINCLNWLPYSCTPHLEKRETFYRNAIKNKLLPAGFGIPDGSIIHFKNETLLYAIGNRLQPTYIV